MRAIQLRLNGSFVKSLLSCINLRARWYHCKEAPFVMCLYWMKISRTQSSCHFECHVFVFDRRYSPLPWLLLCSTGVAPTQNKNKVTMECGPETNERAAGVTQWRLFTKINTAIKQKGRSMRNRKCTIWFKNKTPFHLKQNRHFIP